MPRIGISHYDGDRSLLQRSNIFSADKPDCYMQYVEIIVNCSYLPHSVCNICDDRQ